MANNLFILEKELGILIRFLNLTLLDGGFVFCAVGFFHKQCPGLAIYLIFLSKFYYIICWPL